MGVPPIFHLIFFLQKKSGLLEMDFKHNFRKCNILTSKTLPPHSVTFVTFFFEGVPYQVKIQYLKVAFLHIVHPK